MFSIIGGSGFYGLSKKCKEIDVLTPYGDSKLYIYNIGKKEVVFLARHKKNHSVPPHKINHRANVYALKKIGVTSCLATYAVGVIQKYKPGDLIVLDDFVGTENPTTFFDDFSAGIRHVDFTTPYNKELQSKVVEAAAIHNIKLKKGGIVKTTHGPRFETRSEIAMYKKLGMNLISMTCANETILMKEAEIPFVGLAIGTNYACGVSKKPLEHEEVLEMMDKKEKQINLIAKEMIKLI